MTNKVTSLQAFKAMICFLDEYYNKTLSDDLGSLLGDIQLFQDGSGTWDSAAWNDWLVALDHKELVTEIDAFKGVYNFLNAYYTRTFCSSCDIKVLLDTIATPEHEKILDSSAWNTWMKCVSENS